nr:hypothetical protein [Tanacetum cinerariifolium]
MELVLEQTSAEGVEELKRKVKIKSEKKEALFTLKTETESIHLLLETWWPSYLVWGARSIEWWRRVDSMRWRLALKDVWRCRVVRGIQGVDEVDWLALELKGGDRGSCGLLGDMRIKVEAIENEDEVYNSLLVVKDAKRGEESKLLALNDVIAEALDDIETLETDVKILGGDDNGV